MSKKTREIFFLSKNSLPWQIKKVIPKTTEEEFTALIQRCSKAYKTKKPAIELNFEALINEIKKDISIRSLMPDLGVIAKDFSLEIPNEVTFTRRKQDFNPRSLSDLGHF